MSRRTRLAVFAAGLVFFIILIRQAGLHGLLATLLRAGWSLPIIIAVWGAVYVCNTFAWLQLIRAGTPRTPMGEAPKTIPFLRAYAISVSSFAINYATPFVALGGEPFKLAAASQWLGTDRAAASVVSFRVVHSLGQAIFWLIAVPIAWLLLPDTPAVRAILIVSTLVFLAMAGFFISLFRRGFVVRALGVITHVPLLRRFAPRLERVRPTLETIDNQMAILSDGERSRLVAAIALEVIGRAIAMLEFFVIARAEGLHINYVTAFVIGAFSQFVIVIMIFIPFELGSREGGLALVYDLMHLPAALGVYAGVVSRLRELTWIGIGLTLVWVGGKGKQRQRQAAAGNG